MNFRDWYTDTVDVWRVQAQTTNNLTKNERVQILSGVPCRVYQMSINPIEMSATSATAKQNNWLQCDNSVDIQAGDQLIIHRGAGLGKEVASTRAFASDPNYYFEPFGAVMPGLAHQEIRLMSEERVEGGIQDGGNSPGTNEAN